MPIRYKVVKRKSRTSAVINGNSRYALRYLPGTEVFALPETLGVMTFTTKTAARGFAWNLSDWWADSDRVIVIRVETIGAGRYPHFISNKINTENLQSFYKKDDDNMWLETFPPSYTMCYPGVRVLE